MKKLLKQMTLIEYLVLAVVILLGAFMVFSFVKTIDSAQSIQLDTGKSLMQHIGENVRELKNEFDKGYEGHER